MARVVLGIGASHTTLMNTRWDEVDHLPRAHQFRDALAEASRELQAADVDLVVIAGSNHFRGLWLDMMPSFVMGVEKVESAGEHGTPSGLVRTDPALAQRLCGSLVAADFDVAFSTHLLVDHGISHALQWIVGELDVPILPLVLNCFAPPLPSIGRVHELGVCLKASIEKLHSAARVAVIGTGGLSHALPFPDWRAPRTDDELFLANSWKLGRGDFRKYESRRREIVVNSPPVINEAFDRRFLASFTAGGVREFTDGLTNERLQALAGNGGNELRTWVLMTAALGGREGRVYAYSPMPEWLTGMAVGAISG